MNNKRPQPTFSWNYRRSEILADASVHVLGIVFVVCGGVTLLVLATQEGARSVWAISVYVATLLFLFSMSAAYNLWPVSSMKWWLRRLDHSAIYLLIAGTYTAFVLPIEGSQSLILLLSIWIIAFAGVFLKIFYPGRFDGLAIALYLALGWSGALIFDQLAAVLSKPTIVLIIAGGILYSVGVIFHLAHRLRFHNAIWHAFVLAAAGVHWGAVVSSLS